MSWKNISSAPLERDIIGRWEDGSIERCVLTDDGEDEVYHVLFDGEQRNDMPVLWIEIPELD